MSALARRPSLASVIVLVVLALTAGHVLVSSALAQATVTVAGQVANGTPGGRSPTGNDVVVAAVRDGRPVDQRTTSVGADGRYRVDGLPTGPDISYGVRVEHGGVAYWSAALRAERGIVPPADVAVFETTDDPATVVVERHSVAILQPSAGVRSFEVLELVVMRNDGDRTWKPRLDGPGGPMAVLRFSLPDGASEFRPGGALAGEEVVFSDRGFGTEMPVVPGRQELTFAYRIRYGADAYVMTKTLPYATGVLSLQVPSEIAGSVVGLDEVEPSAAAAGRYRQFAGRDLPARTSLAVHLRGLPGAPPPVLDAPFRWGTLGLTALAAAAAAAYALTRGRRGPADDDVTLLAGRLAQLELSREAGTLDEAAFHRQRTALLVES